MFSHTFLNDLPKDDPISAGILVCDEYLKAHEASGPDGVRFSDTLVVLAMVEALVETFGLDLKLSRDAKDSAVDAHEAISTAYRWFERRANKRTFDDSRREFVHLLGQRVAYEFTDGDLKQIQESISRLREVLTESEVFDEDHKRRLLDRLERLQSELHKRMSNIDLIWGLLADAGVALGKFGKDAKPFADLVQQIARIGWRAQARAEELPSDAPMRLPTEDDEDD